MATANDRQVGGDHYKKAVYEHWDFVNDAGLDYFQGCASKYVARHRDKNGNEDLGKALHYLQKRIELGLYLPSATKEARRKLATMFGIQNGLEPWEKAAVIAIVVDDEPTAISYIQKLMVSAS